jgi:hypothetical protein
LKPVNLEPYSIKSIFEDGCDIVSQYLNDEQISEVASLETRGPTGFVYNEDGELDNGETRVAHWSDIALGLMRNKLMTWEALKDFYADNQALINSTYMPRGDFRELHEYMQKEYSTESTIVAIASYSLFHWCFGYSYRAKRLAAEAARKIEKEKKLVETQSPADVLRSRRERFLASRSPLLEPCPIHCMKCGAFLGMSEGGVLVSAECEQCEQPPLALQASNLASFKRLAQVVASVLMKRARREKP